MTRARSYPGKVGPYLRNPQRYFNGVRSSINKLLPYVRRVPHYLAQVPDQVKKTPHYWRNRGHYWSRRRYYWSVVRPRIIAFLGSSARERTGLQAAAVVLVVCLVIAMVGWTPLSWPARLVNSAVGFASLSGCGTLTGPLLQTCSVALSVFTVAGSLVVAAVMFIFRIPLTRLLRRLLARLPGEAGFLTAPVLATILFTMGWAGIPFHFPDRPGIVRDGLFPVVVGLLTYGTVRYGPLLQKPLKPYFTSRDRLSFKVRLGLTILVPVVLSVVLNLFLSPPVRDQAIVVIAIVAGYLLMAPPTGDVAEGLGEMLGDRSQATARV